MEGQSLADFVVRAPPPFARVDHVCAFLPHLCRADRVWYSYRELDITTAADLLLDEPNDSLEGRKAQVFLQLQFASQKKFNDDVKDVYPFFVQGVEVLRNPTPPAPASAAAPAPSETLEHRLNGLITLDRLADAGFEKSQTAGREVIRERMFAGLAKLYALAPPPPALLLCHTRVVSVAIHRSNRFLVKLRHAFFVQMPTRV